MRLECMRSAAMRQTLPSMYRKRHRSVRSRVGYEVALSTDDGAVLQTWAVFGLRCFGAICAAHPPDPVPANKLRVSVIATSGAESKGAPGEDRRVFSMQDRIYIHVTITWDDGNRPAGEHTFRAEVTQNGRQVKSEAQKTSLNASPFRFWYCVPAAKLALGEAQVLLHVDDLLVASQGVVVAE